jgi:hypothetical protein
MGDANRSQLAYIAEAAWGTTPGTATLQKLRFVDESLAFNIDNIQSNEIRADRQTSDLIQTGAECSGGFSFELSYGAFDDFFVGSLWAVDWDECSGTSTPTITSGATGSNIEFTLDATANTITFGSSVTHDVVAGSWVELTGSAADDGYHFVTLVATNTLTVGATPGISTGEILDETDLATIKGSRLRNGVEENNYSIERFHDDKTQYFGFLGMTPNTLTVNAAANSILTGSFDFIGKSGSRAGSSIGATYTAAAIEDVMNAVSNVGNILEGSTDGTPVFAAMTGVFVQELSFTLNNNVRGQNAIGTLGNADLGVGNAELTGTLNTYFENGDLYDKYLAGTESALTFKVQDSDGNAYIFTFPRVKFQSDTVNVGGLNSDVMENLTWQAIRHATYGYTINIDKFDA